MENNWKTEEALTRAAVTLETERIKGSNPWCLWWWWWSIPGESLVARYNWCQGPVPGCGPAVEKQCIRGYRPITWELKKRRTVAMKRNTKRNYIKVNWAGRVETEKHELLQIVPEEVGSGTYSSVLHTSRTRRLAHYTVYLEVSASLSMQVLSLRHRSIFIYRKVEKAYNVSRISQQKRQ